MKTVAIDTNAILNFRLKRAPHYKQVKSLFETCLDGNVEIFVPEAVFLESEWVLRSYYKQTKKQVVSFFQELLLLDHIVVKNRAEVELCINLYQNASGVSFTDCLILCQIQSSSVDEFLTFDDKLKKLYQKL